MQIDFYIRAKLTFNELKLEESKIQISFGNKTRQKTKKAKSILICLIRLVQKKEIDEIFVLRDIFQRIYAKLNKWILAVWVELLPKSSITKKPLLKSVFTCSKINNGNTRAIYKICSKLTIKTTNPCQWSQSGVSDVNFEQILHKALVCSLFNFDQINAVWERLLS